MVAEAIMIVLALGIIVVVLLLLSIMTWAIMNNRKEIDELTRRLEKIE